MSSFRCLAIALTVASMLCLAPGLSALATGQSDPPSCCKPTSPCGTGLTAADCCRAERVPQADAPTVGPVAMTKKQLESVGHPGEARHGGEQTAADPATGAPFVGHLPSAVHPPSAPLFLTHAALLI